MGEVFALIESGATEEELDSFGHTFLFAFSACDLEVQPYTFKKDVETKCKNLSTSWSFEFVVEQLPGRIATCNITAKRADSMDKPVTINIELSYSYVKYPSIESQFLLTKEMNPGQEMQVLLDNTLPFPEESKMYLAGGITVQVRFWINCCDSMKKTFSRL